MKVYPISIITQVLYDTMWKTTITKNELNGNERSEIEKFPLYNKQGETYEVPGVGNVVDIKA